MASGCCENKADELAELRERQRRILWAVLAINAVLFVVEFTVGWWARSTALLADSLDMLGDAFVYAFSLWVLQRGARWRARAALSKGLVQLGFGVVVLGQATWRAIEGSTPNAGAMGWMGLVALAGNTWAFYLLWRHRSDDLNMRSTWLCSRNDLVANTSVLGAAVLVAWLDSPWPDVAVGVAIALLFLRTAADVIADSRAELRAASKPSADDAHDDAAPSSTGA
ncbi:MAG: cation transporter [Acidimicrobiales bacterium]|nr:cation transporter [Acidimicrobiales bacterium]